MVCPTVCLKGIGKMKSNELGRQNCQSRIVLNGQSKLVDALSPVNHKRWYHGWKQTSFHPLLIPHIVKPQTSSKFTKLVSTKISNKTYEHQTHIFEETVHQVSSLLKTHITRLGQAGVVVSRLIYPHQIDKYIDKQWKDTFSKLILCEGIMANTSVTWQHPAHTTD